MPLLAALAVGAAVLGAPAAPVLAADCPDVELVFARGTGEPAGIGRVGQALADTLAPQLGGRSLATYGVNYPAGINFLATAGGANDAAAHLSAIAGACPNTRLVLGGFSQGAAVVSMLAGVPPVGDRIGSLGSAPPLPPGTASHLCSGGDPICSQGGRDRAAHNGYEFPPYVSDAAAFVAART